MSAHKNSERAVSKRGLTVEVRAGRDEKESKNNLEHVFERFYRVDPSRQRKGENSGIGLAIVKSIVLAHRGKIGVTSDTVATRFTLELPRL